MAAVAKRVRPFVVCCDPIIADAIKPSLAGKTGLRFLQSVEPARDVLHAVAYSNLVARRLLTFDRNVACVVFLIGHVFRLALPGIGVDAM
jgi:hypothetical protein